MSDPKHPVWYLLKLAILMATLTGILYVTANHFDASELKTIVSYFLAAAGIEGLGVVAGKLMKGE